jgi:flavodoxin
VNKILLAFYSHTGTTRALAEHIAGLCPCDTEEIQDLQSRSGILGTLRSGWDGLMRRPTPIKPSKLQALNYDLIVVGTPVWVGGPAAPVRRYLIDNRTCFNRVAFFCTLGGSGADKALAAMERVAGRTPIATLSVFQGEVASNRFRDKAREFVDALKQAISKTGHDGAASPHADVSKK